MQPGARAVLFALGKVRDAQAIVLDLRGNEGGTIEYGVDLLSFLMRSGPVATFEDRCKGGAKEMQVVRINVNRIMTRIKRAKRSRSEWRTRQKYLLNDRPLVVLVDKNTASTAELVAGCLKDNGFLIFGKSQTWGKAIGQEYVKLPGGYSLVVTGLRWFTP
jgi:carboxyl-terminal processing protease